MTRAESSPVTRIVSTDDGEYVMTAQGRYLTMRPLRSRKGGSGEVSIAWGAIYYRAMLARVEASRTKKKPRITRGRIA